MDNRTIIQKADLALADLTAGGGLLQPAQAAEFMRILIERSVVMNMATFVPMKAQTFQIDQARFANRILRAGQEATALGVAERSKPDLTKVSLDAKLFKAEVRMSDETLEDSIEQGRFKDTVLELMTDALSRDMEDVIVNSDTANGALPAELRQLDGLLKQATSNVVNNGGLRLKRSTFKNSLKALPDEFHVNKSLMRFLTSVNAEIDYRDSVAERATGYGDVTTTGSLPLAVFGVPLMDVPLFPEDLGGGNNETNMLLLDPKNIHIGMWRNIRMETDRDIVSGQTIFVATIRFDTKYAFEPAVVKATAILAT